MAYPPNPARRFAWDADGSVVLFAKGQDGPLSQGTGPTDYSYLNATTQQKEDMNDEDLATDISVNAARQSAHWCILFAEQRELDGIYWAVHDFNTEQWTDTSVDTTNGHDGNWVDLSYAGEAGEPSDGYRDNITSEALSNILAVRFFIGRSQVSSGQARFKSMHLYGSVTPGGTPDRLIFLDPDNSDAEFTKPLDFGETPRGQTQVDTFKVKNNSAGVTANTVQVTAEDLSLGSASWYQFSLDNVAFQGTLGLGNIGVGATVLVYVKQIVPDAQVPGAYVARVKANQASWS